VVLIGRSLPAVTGDLLDRMLSGGGELVTLLIGADAPADLAVGLERRVARDHPGVEVTAYAGGQPAPVLIGVE
jgi:dihydroxyacetone kinase-like predicted kinase